MGEVRSMAIDIETFSDVDLLKCGVYAYSDSPAFAILLFAYCFDDGEIEIIDLANGEELPSGVVEALIDENVIKTAFNANFERVCLSKHLGIKLSAKSWHCTAVQASMLALPLSLSGVGSVLGLSKQKMEEGKELLRYFCMPCKPTKTNQGRERNLPHHDIDKWERFKNYCIRDVDVEKQIRGKLCKYPISEQELLFYQLDQEINDRGVLVDKTLVKQAIICDLLHKEVVTNKAYEITGLENPNSVAQLKTWFAGHGLMIESLSKAVVADLMKEADGEVFEALRLRLLMAKTSVKKYEAIKRSLCTDKRVHGLLQFYGANRSGRWAGRLLQVQNLPKNHIADLEVARELVKKGCFEAIEILYDTTPGVLSELIRTALVPKQGCKFFVADFSAIEARVLAWLAGEKWRLDVFLTHGKIYEASASAMFGVPIEEIGKGSELRQKGKVSELACIAGGSLVLTNEGLVPIEDVTTDHLLWDGEEWVRHEGVVYKGEREVIYYDGLRATKDHLVWVQGKEKPIYFGESAKGREHLIRTGNGGNAVWVGENHLSGKEMEQSKKSLLCFYAMHRLWKSAMARIKQFKRWEIKGMSKLFTAKENSKVVRSKINCSKAKMRKSEHQKLRGLRREGHSILLFFSIRSRAMAIGKRRQCKSGVGVGPNQQRWELRAGQSSFCQPSSKSSQSKKKCIALFSSRGVALCKNCSDKDVIRWHDQRANTGECKGKCEIKEEAVAIDRGKVRVYDIRNAGKRHRFTVSGVLVHNCGYGGSVGALKAMGGVEMGLSEIDMSKLISDWRNANPHITAFWWAVDKAAVQAVKEKKKTKVGRITFYYTSGILFITLPSGRKLSYIKPRLAVNRYGKDALTYEGIGENKRWERIDTYGPKLVENIVQAASRDILAESMIRLRDAGFDIVFHVHDEAVMEVPKGSASIEEVCDLMAIPPTWADGLPLRADGYICDFYKKD